MKNRNKLIVFGFTAIVILATSCSTEKGLTIEKRHYRKGYSIAWHGKSKTEKMVESKQPESANAINKMPSITVESFTKQNEPQVALASNGSETTLKAIQTETKNRILSEHTSTTKIAAEPQKKFTASEKREIRKFLTKQAPGQTDIPLWAYILIAILIPPLAVGLYEGIETPFWLCLVLTILFWIPGAIYALWRVLRNE